MKLIATKWKRPIINPGIIFTGTPVIAPASSNISGGIKLNANAGIIAAIDGPIPNVNIFK